MNFRHLSLSFGCLLLLTGAFSSSGPSRVPVKKKAAQKPTVDFNRDVRPLLAQHCWPCHGQDKVALANTGGISLDTFMGATTDHGGIRPIVPGHPELSAAVARMSATGQNDPMPPAGSGIKPLSPAEIQIIKTWIKEGAEYRAHWAFVAPKMPTIPTVKDAKWAKNDVDRFILARLDEEGIKPQPEADKRTLIRRATYTLIGLPPTPQEVDSFLQDKRPDAYEHLVDRLLASPRFGENQARYWMDAVRYADTHGLHIDNERSVYPYRDWVVRAYNEDLPYDKFALWQIAGDMLPNPTLDQMIATGYVRLNPTTNEGGAIEAEFLAKNTMDRVDTTSTVFLGVTLQCAKCHDHKYDPFTQKDYYSMYAYFDSTQDTPLDGNLRLPPPVMPAPSPEQSTRLAVLSKSMAEDQAKVDLAAARAWALTAAPKAPTVGDWQVAGPFGAGDFDAAFAQLAAPGNAAWRPIQFALDTLQPGIIGKPNAAVFLRTKLTAPAAGPIDLRLGSDDGIRVWLNGKLIHENKIMRALAANQDMVKADLNAGANDLLVEIVNADGQDGAYVGIGSGDSVLTKASMIAQEASPKPEEVKSLEDTYLQMGPQSPTSYQYRQVANAYQKENAAVPMTYIAKELPMARTTFLLRRGQYDLPGDQVPRAIPKVFGSLTDTKNNNRLGLAEWIVNPQNPLTARVMVNRIWQQHFGTGLVKSSEDFGSRGDWPTHPELLDYLACKFVKDGWSIKKLTRMLVTSATFRQSAAASEVARRKDPDNTYLSRGPRFRLDAEVIRDTALYVSGLLVDIPGGHSDKPYQPPGLWEIIAYPISDTAKYKQDHGDALYRRSLYLFWKRTSPPPVMMLLDAPMRESCVVRRSRTNTPTQALATLNETGFFEDARNMAQRVIKAKSGDDARIDYAFRLVTSRPPTAAEVGVVKGFLADARAKYKADPAGAEATLKVGESPRDVTIPAHEHAAWTLICNMILNLDEALTQH